MNEVLIFFDTIKRSRSLSFFVNKTMCTMSVVYFDQHLGVVHTKHWSESAKFLHVFTRL